MPVSIDGAVLTGFPGEEVGFSFWRSGHRRAILVGGASGGSGLWLWELDSGSLWGSGIGLTNVLRGDSGDGLRIGFINSKPSIAWITSSIWAILAVLFLDLFRHLKAILVALKL